MLIACRMSPKQKADIVRMIQEHSPLATTLSIGDGANDVNMINAAHIGVGISGLEGQQASSASDYAIGEFKFLKTLLFYHGREDYRRNCYLVNYTFYKNIFFVMPHFFMAFHSMASGVSFYEEWLYQIFNIFFAGVPIMIYALIDEEHSRKDLLSKPELYKIGPKNYCFTTRLFWTKWVFYGVAQAALLFYVTFLSFGFSPQVPGGDIGDIWVEGSFVYGAVAIIVNLKLLYDGNTHTFASMFLIWLQILTFFVMFALFASIKDLTIYGLADEIPRWPIFYMAIIYFALMPVPIDTAIRMIEKEYIQEKEQEEEIHMMDYQRKLTKGLDKSKFKHLMHNHKGYAFSGDSGQVPQITDKLRVA